MPVADWDTPQWKDLVRRRAVEQAERMRLEGVYRSPLSSLAVKRLLTVLGPTQKLMAVNNYLGAVIAAWGPLIDAAGTAARNETQVVSRAQELSGLMREGERMRLSYALRCGGDPVADVYVAGRFSGVYEGPLGRIDFAADGSYVFLSTFGTRVQGRHRLESGRVFLASWHSSGAEQWFHLRQGCLIEPAFGKEMFCSGRAPKW